MWNKKEGEEQAVQLDALKARREVLRDVFTSEKGTVVLALILDDLHYFDAKAKAEDVGLVNYAKELLAQIGTGNGYDIARAIISSYKGA